MATRDLKLRLELDGEKKFKEAVAEINRESKTLGAQMKKLAEEYKGNEDSIEALTKKQTLLDRALLESKAKVEETRKQLDSWKKALERVRQEQGASSEEYKQAQKKVQEYEYALANAETQELKLENAIRENNEALQHQGEELDDENGKMVSLGDAVDQVAGKLGIKLPDGAKKALDGMKSMSAGSVAAIGAIATAVAATIKAIEKLNDMTLDAAQKADDLMTRSMQSSVSTTMLQQWEYAASYIDVSVDTITGALSKVTKAAADNKDAFGKLGVAVTDSGGQLRDSEAILWDTLRALSEIPNETERNAIAQELLGKSYEELNPLILQLDEAERRYNEAMEKGYVLSESQLEILGDVDDAHEHYTQTIEKNKDLIATQWAPATKEAYEMMANLIDKAGKTLVDSGLISNFASLVQSTLSLFDACSSLFGAMPSWLSPINMLSTQLRGLATILATVADFANLVVGILPFNWGSGMAKTALGLNMSNGQMSNLQKLKYGNSAYDGWSYNEELGAWNASGNDNWRGGLTWVGEAGPELVSLPRGSQIYNAQDSRNMGGSQVININVNGIQQMDEVVRWYESRRIRGRMA